MPPEGHKQLEDCFMIIERNEIIRGRENVGDDKVCLNFSHMSQNLGTKGNDADIIQIQSRASQFHCKSLSDIFVQ